MCLTKRHSLRASSSADVREICSDTSTQHIAADELIVSYNTVAAATKALKSDQQKKATDHFFSLQLQGALAKSVTESVSSRNI